MSQDAVIVVEGVVVGEGVEVVAVLVVIVQYSSFKNNRGRRSKMIHSKIRCRCSSQCQRSRGSSSTHKSSISSILV